VRHDGSQIKGAGICASSGPSKNRLRRVQLVVWHQSTTNRVVRHHRILSHLLQALDFAAKNIWHSNCKRQGRTVADGIFKLWE
jgi:hypothetical protein